MCLYLVTTMPNKPIIWKQLKILRKMCEN
jgi:hypothetical protein